MAARARALGEMGAECKVGRANESPGGGSKQAFTAMETEMGLLPRPISCVGVAGTGALGTDITAKETECPPFGAGWEVSHGQQVGDKSA